VEWLNYHHLQYFWVVAKEGSIARASKVLRLAHPTISGQIHRLEEVLDEQLFEHKGRNLVLTDAGRVAFGYADEIFSLGQEFLDSVKGRTPGRPVRVVVGLSDVLPKSIVHRMLEPALSMEKPVQIVCREARSTEAFLGDLALQAVDVVLTDTPAPPTNGIRVFNHLLGECGTALMANKATAKRLRGRFPDSLDGVPFVLPGTNAALRSQLDEWFERQSVRPKIVAEVEDSSLMRVFGEAGVGVFAVPDVIEDDLQRRYQVALVGRAPELIQRFYAISVERKLKHPAVVAICDATRKKIFGGPKVGKSLS
jgi:LysR family transcriptional regulator, transcriptional activator of nhaA